MRPLREAGIRDIVAVSLMTAQCPIFEKGAFRFRQRLKRVTVRARGLVPVSNQERLNRQHRYQFLVRLRGVRDIYPGKASSSREGVKATGLLANDLSR